MSLQFNPRWRLAWAAASALVVGLSVGLDGLVRSWGGRGLLAPTAASLWLSVALGAAVGLAGLLWERHLLRHRRAFLLAFHRMPLSGRLEWKHQRTNLQLNGWFFLVLFALIGWCAAAGVFVLPALFAANAAQFAGNRRLAAEFHAELLHDPNA
jgi:hypothetical protein